MSIEPFEESDESFEAELAAQLTRPYQRLQYTQCFHPPGDPNDWAMDGLFPEAYYESAVTLLSNICEDRGYYEWRYAIPAIFLARHCLELQLKYVLYHSRWLKEARVNQSQDDIEAVGKDHHRLAPL